MSSTERKPFLLRVPPDLLDQISDIADGVDRSRNWVITAALRQYCNENPAEIGRRMAGKSVSAAAEMNPDRQRDRSGPRLAEPSVAVSPSAATEAFQHAYSERQAAAKRRQRDAADAVRGEVQRKNADYFAENDE
jgi:predicted transcriptional regulator